MVVDLGPPGRLSLKGQCQREIAKWGAASRNQRVRVCLRGLPGIILRLTPIPDRVGSRAATDQQ